MAQEEQVQRIIHENNKTDYSISVKTITGPADDRKEVTIRADTVEDFKDKLTTVKKELGI